MSSYCSCVRQITFNAWHYAEANLWASLAAHIFDNLSSGGSEDDLRRRADELAKLRGKEKSLLTQLSAARLERMMVAAQHEREPFTLDLTHDDFRWVGKVLGVPEASIDQVRQFATGMLGFKAKARQVLSLFRRSKLAWILLGSGIVLTVGIVLLLRSPLWPAIIALVSTVVAAVTPFAREVHKAAGRIKDAADTKKAATGKRLADLDAETERLERAVAELAPGRDATAFAQSRQASEDYRQHLGVVSLLRRDLETFAAILDEGAAGRRRAGADRALHRRPGPVPAGRGGEGAGGDPPAGGAAGVRGRGGRGRAVAAAGDRAALRGDAPDAPVAGELPGEDLPDPVPAVRHGRHRFRRPGADAGRHADKSPRPRPSPVRAGAGAAAPAPRNPVARHGAADLRPRQLEISDAEMDFLSRLAPLVPSPRAAKRLINLYRLLRARLSGPELDAFVVGRRGGGRAGVARRARRRGRGGGRRCSTGSARRARG